MPQLLSKGGMFCEHFKTWRCNSTSGDLCLHLGSVGVTVESATGVELSPIDKNVWNTSVTALSFSVKVHFHLICSRLSICILIPVAQCLTEKPPQKVCLGAYSVRCWGWKWILSLWGACRKRPLSCELLVCDCGLVKPAVLNVPMWCLWNRLQNVLGNCSSSTLLCQLQKHQGSWRTEMTKSCSILIKKRYFVLWAKRGVLLHCIWSFSMYFYSTQKCLVIQCLCSDGFSKNTLRCSLYPWPGQTCFLW